MEGSEARDYLVSPFSNSTRLNEMLVEKWAPMMEGVSGDRMRVHMAKLMENEANSLMILQESVTSGVNVGEYTKFVFPVVRKVFPNLLANNIASVQPMTAPVGAIFYFNFKYGTAYAPGGINEGDGLVGSDLNGVAGKFDSRYSNMEKAVTAFTVGTGDAVSKVFRNVLKDGATVVHNIMQGSLTIKATFAAGTENTFTAADDGNGGLRAMTGTNGNIVGGFIDYKSGAIVVEFSGAPKDATAVKADFQYETEGVGGDIKEINMDIQMQAVRARSKKLKGLWSTESADDFKALHGMDAEVEIVGGIASEIQLEVDRGIVANMLACVDTGGTSYASWSRSVPNTGVSEVNYIRSLLTKISHISNIIHRKTLRGTGNWIVAGPEVVSLLDALPEFVPATEDPGNVTYPGIVPAGTLSGRWKVYRDPLNVLDSNSSDILIGYKGPSWLDAGYVYAPYVPLQVTPTFLDPQDFNFKKGLRTRFAEKLVRPEFFGIVHVTGLNVQFAS